MFEALKYEYIPKPVSHSNVLCIVYFFVIDITCKRCLVIHVTKKRKKIQRGLKGLSRLIICGDTTYLKNNTISCRLQIITHGLVN